jgi:hypothetical protein
VPDTTRLEPQTAHAREHYESGLPRYVEQELRAYLKCGVFSEGFTRCHRDTCGHDLLVAILLCQHGEPGPPTSGGSARHRRYPPFGPRQLLLLIDSRNRRSRLA